MFGEPIDRIVEFVAVVVQVVIELILRLMNFPSDLLAHIIDQTVAAITDIQARPGRVPAAHGRGPQGGLPGLLRQLPRRT